jgi:hypothetical protein
MCPVLTGRRPTTSPGPQREQLESHRTRTGSSDRLESISPESIKMMLHCIKMRSIIGNIA